MAWSSQEQDGSNEAVVAKRYGVGEPTSCEQPPLPTRTPSATPTRQTLVCSSAEWTPMPTATAPAGCLGDCSADGSVTVDELVRGVNIALESLPLATCPSFDRNGDTQVGMNELVACADALLNGCS